MDESSNAKFQQLLILYVQHLPNKIKEIEMVWEDLISREDSAKLKDLHRLIHSLCGSSGTYGYQALSHIARELESFLKAMIDRSMVLTEEKQQQITQLLQQIVSAAKECTPATSTMGLAHTPITALAKIIYIVDTDEYFIGQLNDHLVDAGYVLKRYNEFSKLQQALQEQQPVAMIVDIEELSSENIQQLANIRTHHGALIPLLCTAKTGDLLKRLQAVHAGSFAFFQKPIEMFHLLRVLEDISATAGQEFFRILIVDDSISVAEYYALVLQQAGMETEILIHPLELLTALQSFRPDLLLMDIYMPECSGLELASVLRQHPLYTGLPIIFLSVEGDRFKQLSAISVGGDDFLMKPVLPQHLIATVRSRAKRASIITSLMTRDSLTELYNHTTILAHLDLELIRAKREGIQMSFVILDIDFFKFVNDRHGHPVGDEVLKRLAELLLSQLRKTDIVGRYGGEEFAIIMPDTDKDTSFALMNLLREEFSAIEFESKIEKFHITFSAGIASYPAISEAASLVVTADQALYKAKYMGRNRVIHFEEMHLEIKE